MVNVNFKDFPYYNFKLSKGDPLKFAVEHQKEMKSELIIPSKAHSYSMCIEYVKEWFENAFSDTFFKSSYINGKNVIDDFRGLSRQQLVKRNRPCYTITPSIDYEFNRENVDFYEYGANIFNNRCGLRSSFYKNYENNTYLSLDFKLVLMKFNFRIKVNTLSVAQDLFDFMQIKFRSGGTMGRYLDLDFHVPTHLMNAVAMDNGFEIKDNKVVDETGFLCFMNQHSDLPIMYKRRNATGNMQYFVKVPNCYTHFRMSEIRIDEGERQGQIMTNFTVDFDTEVRFPCPKFYAYFFFKESKYMPKYEEETNTEIRLEDFPILSVPKTNKKGWNQFITTEYLDDEESFENKEKLNIEFIDLIGDIRKVIDYTKSISLSPSVFVDIKLFNANKEIDIDIDWDKYLIKSKVPMDRRTSFIVLYVDTAYLNENILRMKDQIKERVSSFVQSKIVRG